MSNQFKSCGLDDVIYIYIYLLTKTYVRSMVILQHIHIGWLVTPKVVYLARMRAEFEDQLHLQAWGDMVACWLFGAHDSMPLQHSSHSMTSSRSNLMDLTANLFLRRSS